MSGKKVDKNKKPESFEAPESSMVRQETDPSQPDGASEDDAKSSTFEAPESGTMREK